MNTLHRIYIIIYSYIMVGRAALPFKWYALAGLQIDLKTIALEGRTIHSDGCSHRFR